MQPIARGRRVIARLEVLGWTRKRLGEEIGEIPSQITKMLNATDGKGIGPVDAWRIARATGLTEMYILYGDRSGLSPEVIRLLPPEN
jgi:hypothetical protein